MNADGSGYFLVSKGASEFASRILGQKYSCQLASTFNDVGTITSVSGQVISVDKLPDDTTMSSYPGTSIHGNFLWIPVDPTAGTTDILNFAAHSEGWQTTASGGASHAEGYKTKAVGKYSHAEGRQTTAYFGAHAEGISTIASGLQSHAEGYLTKAQGKTSHAEGDRTPASGDASHAEGGTTSATGLRSHAEGWQTNANGENAHAEGQQTHARGKNSHAEGESTVAKAECAHAEGKQTAANGAFSHAEGYLTQANHTGSHAGGVGTKTGSQYQSVCGAYNEPREDAYHIVGAGAHDTARSNAWVVFKDGHGEIQTQGTTDNSVVQKQYVDNLVEQLKAAIIALGGTV